MAAAKAREMATSGAAKAASVLANGGSDVSPGNHEAKRLAGEMQAAKAGMQAISAPGGFEATPEQWHEASKWKPIPPTDGAQIVKMLTEYGYQVQSGKVWGPAGSDPQLRLSVSEHKEKAEHTWYIVKCSLQQADTASTVNWEAPRRLDQIRGSLHDNVKFDMDENGSHENSAYSSAFGATPFAHPGGMPGTTNRLNEWLASLAKAINGRAATPYVVALTLQFCQAPVPNQTDAPPTEDDFDEIVSRQV